MQFWLKPNTHPHLQARFTIDKISFTSSKIVGVSLRTAGKSLAQVFYSEPNNYKIDADISSTDISNDQPQLVSLSVDPAWTAPDGVVLGVLLKSVTLYD
jgi:hypothetical protein